MRYVFEATQIGWDKNVDIVWFNKSAYSYEEAVAEFKEYQGETINGYPYTGYEYDGIKYHDFKFLGEFEEDKMPYL
ncbi:hypothetical protein [Streptococcus uberis]|uniref:hypothetical protein n=1 Tax=Streptococcus uberis TaxID=1349 RepID=UPI0012B62BDA|nr:hypothetical protein [Streptococcus uberis]MTB58876.1 hypothetical protein [Streptococcus uberis]MTC00167.1 hypothetical protein [Streptococcus uberis]